jgi:hypothetical protein
MSEYERKTSAEVLDEHLVKDLMDLEIRRRSQQRAFLRRQPKRVKEVMAQLVQRRGYARVQQAGACEEAWKEAVGEAFHSLTRVGSVRRGVLEVFVANSLVVQELGFEKERIVAQLRELVPEMQVNQIRFRIGNP